MLVLVLHRASTTGHSPLYDPVYMQGYFMHTSNCVGYDIQGDESMCPNGNGFEAVSKK